MCITKGSNITSFIIKSPFLQPHPSGKLTMTSELPSIQDQLGNTLEIFSPDGLTKTLSAFIPNSLLAVLLLLLLFLAFFVKETKC